MRVAGGWVRDKMLGKESDDIDITLDDMKGEDFAKLVDLKVNKGEKRFGTTKANKEKSKHFETTGMTIYGIELDFVNFWNLEKAHEYASKYMISAWTGPGWGNCVSLP